MIHKTLFSIKEYLEKKMGNGVGVELERIRKDADSKEHDIVITLLHIEEESSRKPQNCYWTAPDRTGKSGERVLKSPDVDINLTILISSQASQYETALKQISEVISIMNSIKTAPKPAKLSDETFEAVRSVNISLQNMSFDQNLSLWQTLGSGMVPSLVYKVRMLTVQGIPEADVIKNVDKIIIEPGGMDRQREEPASLPVEKMKSEKKKQSK